VGHRAGRGLAIAVVLALSPAHGDVVQVRAAALFDEGRALIEAGNIALACEKFAASLGLDPQLGTRLNLADCVRRQGKLLEAYRLFEDAIGDAEREGKPGRAEFAREQMAELERKLGRVIVSVDPGSTPGLVIRIGSRSLPAAEWSDPQVVSPGKIVIEASAPDHRSLRIEREVFAGASETVTILPLAPIPVHAETHEKGSRTVPILIIGVGGAMLGASAGLGVYAKSAHTKAFSARNENGVKRAQHMADVATGIAIAGGVATAVGLVLFVRSPRRDRVVVTPMQTATLGVEVVGWF
jgi:hypothetical protein